MPKARAIVPLTHPETGEPIAAGAVVELGSDFYRDLRATGAVEASEEEQKAAGPPPEGKYAERTGREETASTKTEKAPEKAPEKKK